MCGLKSWRVFALGGLLAVGLMACAVPPTPTAFPTSAPTGAPTSTRPAPTVPSVTHTPTPDLSVSAHIISFTVTSDKERPGPGDSVTITWQTEGGQAYLGIGYGGAIGEGPGSVAPSGTLAYALRTQDPVADHWADFYLYVSGASSSADQTIRLHVKCWYPWFKDGLTKWCSDAATASSEAIAQTFEHGVMLQSNRAGYHIAPCPTRRPCNHPPG